MKILILGHKGMLGSDLMARLGGTHEVAGKDIDEIDITSAASCRDIICCERPEVIVNAAAYTDVDKCESERDACFAVNAEGVRNIAMAGEEVGARFVHFSTDYVFDGTSREPYREDDPTNPLSAYGQSKLRGEHYLQECATHFILIRTAWLYGKNGKNFVKTIINKAQTEKKLNVVDDQTGSPTFSWDLAGAVQELIEGNHKGVFHVTNRGTCSWYEFARKIIQYKGIAGVTVSPMKSDQLTRPAPRPSYSVLSGRKFVEATGKTMRFWQIALEDYISRLT